MPLSATAGILHGRFKLIMDAEASWHYTPNNTRIQSTLACSNTKPCLFDLLQDPSETVNVYDKHIGRAKKMESMLKGFKQYTEESMSDAELQPYHCIDEPKRGHVTSAWPWAPPHF